MWKNLQTALEAKRREFDECPQSGAHICRTAVPLSWARNFLQYAKAVERDSERVRRSAEGLRRLGIGGTAVGSGLNAHPEYHASMVKKLSEFTGLQLVRIR
jgi:fumarate hydratase class II